MRIVLDTNVLVSGIFFGGISGQVLDAWRKHHVSLVYTPSITSPNIRESRQSCGAGTRNATPIQYSHFFSARASWSRISSYLNR